MSLLERRRILLAEAADKKEGGGENDGKYVYMVCRYGVNTNCWSASVDYGVSFQGNTTTAVKRSYSCSNAFDCNGNLFYQGGGAAYSGTYLPFSEVTAPSQITTRSRATFQGFQPASSSRAWCWSTDGKQCIRFSTPTTASTYTNTRSLQLWDNYGSTPTAPQLSLNSYLTVPSWTTVSGKFTNASGPYLKFNSDTLQVGFLGDNGRCGLGQGRNGTTCSFTRDGGLTWTDEKDIIIADTSQSLGNDGFTSGHISNDGKHVGFVHCDTNNHYTLYVSHDYGATFNSVDTSAIVGDIQNFETSAKFKTWYLSAYKSGTTAQTASIWKSTNRGRTWVEVIRHEAKATEPIYEWFHCNDAGDKLVNVYVTGSFVDINSTVYYSHDGGTTWTSSGLVNGPREGTWNFWMCRDSYNV